MNKTQSSAAGGAFFIGIFGKNIFTAAKPDFSAAASSA